MDQRVDEPQAKPPAFLDVESFVRKLQVLETEIGEIQTKLRKLEADQKTNNHER